jgi:hypothetical protein
MRLWCKGPVRLTKTPHHLMPLLTRASSCRNPERTTRAMPMIKRYHPAALALTLSSTLVVGNVPYHHVTDPLGVMLRLTGLAMLAVFVSRSVVAYRRHRLIVPVGSFLVADVFLSLGYLFEKPLAVGPAVLASMGGLAVVGYWLPGTRMIRRAAVRIQDL